MFDTAGNKTSSSDEQISEKVPKMAEKTTKKSEAKPVKSNKKLKEEEKKLSKSSCTELCHLVRVLHFVLYM